MKKKSNQKHIMTITERVAKYLGISVEDAERIDLMDLTQEDMDAIDNMEEE